MRTANSTAATDAAGIEFVDLFAGAGGLSLGFEQQGFVVGCAVEDDHDAAATYRAAHGGTVKMHETDIALVDFRPYRGTPVVVGGPPCQPWSLGGYRNGHGDTRDGIPQFARALHEIQPRIFVLENVAGLARGETKTAFDRIVQVLAGELPLCELLGDLVGPRVRLDYNVGYRVLNADDYGVPQRRQRLIVVGTSEESAFDWPSPTHGPGRRRPHKPVAGVLGEKPFGTPNTAIVTYAKRPSIRPDPYHGQVFNGGGRPMDLSRPAPTLLASMGGNKTPWIDTERVVPEYHAHLVAGGKPRSGQVPGARRISVEEAALLQTFPATFNFEGTRSSQYRQVGNAVPPNLAGAVARQVRRALR